PNSAVEGMVRNQKGLAIVSSVTKPGDSNLEKAIAEFRRVLEISDQDPIVSYNLGVTLLKFNKDTEGIHELQNFVARSGNTMEATTARKLIADPRRARENFAPDFTLTTLDGEYVTLEDLKGKVVLLDFWGTWCPPCRESTPSLVRYSKKHSSEIFVMLGVAVNEPSDAGWREYVEKNKMAWPQYIDSSRKISNLFKITAFPTYITIDADGIIRDRRTGWNSETMTNIDDQVKKAVKAREKAGTPALKAPPERPRPPAGGPTTQSNPVPDIIVPTMSSITVAGVSPAPTTAPVAGISAIPGNTIPSAGVSVRGRVVRLPGAASALRANLILPGPQPVTTSAVVAPDGSFEFFNVRSGNYNLTLSVPVPFRPIVVGSTDVTGIEFTVPPMRNTPGRAVLEGPGGLPQRPVFGRPPDRDSGCQCAIAGGCLQCFAAGGRISCRCNLSGLFGPFGCAWFVGSAARAAPPFEQRYKSRRRYACRESDGDHCPERAVSTNRRSPWCTSEHDEPGNYESRRSTVHRPGAGGSRSGRRQIAGHRAQRWNGRLDSGDSGPWVGVG
ncbi:MAG TPA: redoxin domain-containing protein, partial [Terriglobia bacterium]|nr:redoxin domain-containing protein [Terriglobia bacterium]